MPSYWPWHLVRHLPGHLSGIGFLAEVAQDWAQLVHAAAPSKPGEQADPLAVGRVRAAAGDAADPAAC